MKKMLSAFVIMTAMIAAVSVYASTTLQEHIGCNHSPFATQMTSQGRHCRGTVGCDCPGFSPIMNGDVWQQAYCRHCGHKRSFHNH